MYNFAMVLKMELIWRIQILLLLSEPKGFTCDLCVNLLTEIENILEDQTIDDAVITYFLFSLLFTIHEIQSDIFFLQWKILV